jgi:hypothetical protein
MKQGCRRGGDKRMLSRRNGRRDIEEEGMRG